MTVSAGSGVSLVLVQPSIYRGTTQPTNELQVGDLWEDTSVNPPVLRQCSSISPVTFVPVGSGGAGSLNISAGTTNSSATAFSFSNGSGVTFGMNGNTITASVATAGAAQTGISSVALSNTTYTSGQISFSDANGISFGSGAGQAINITHGLQYTSNTSNITSNALNTNASRVFNVVAATNNTGGGTASLSSNVSFSAANGLTFYTSAGNAIVGSYTVPTQSVQTQASGNIARTGFTTGATAGSVLVGTHDTAGLSLGVPAWITTYVGQTVQPVAWSGSGGSSNFSTLNFSNASNISFSNSNGSIQVVHNLAGTSTGFAGANISGSITNNSSGINISLSVAAPGAAAENNWVNLLGANTAGNTTASGSTLGFSGVNLTLSGTNNSQLVFSAPATSSLSATGAVSISVNGSTISIGAPNQTSWSVSDNATSGTVGRLAFTNLNGVTLSLSSGTGGLHTIVGSYNSTQFAGQGTSITGNASITLDSAGIKFNGSGLAGTNTATTGGNFAWTVNSSGISINGSNIAGTTTAVTGRASITLNTAGLQFNGSALVGSGTATAVTGRASITLSPNSSSIAMSFDGNGIAGTGFTTGTTTGAWTATNSTAGLSMVMPFRTRAIFPADEQITAVSAPANASMSFRYIQNERFLTATRADFLMGMSFSTSGGAGTQTLQQSAYCVIYTKNGASLSSLSSGTTQTTWTMASNSAGQTQLSQAAIRYISVPININMQPGEYYVGINYITAGTAVSLTQSLYGGNDIQTASNYADMASQTNATTGQLWGAMGVYNAASTGMPASVSISSINQTGANLSRANFAIILRNA
jgi:hypothetical protein